MAEGIKLGQEVRDRVTGYQGIVVSVTDFLNGCKRMGIQRKFDPKKDKETTDPEMFDEPDLVLIGRGILPEPEPEPKPRAPRYGDPSFKPRRTR